MFQVTRDPREARCKLHILGHGKRFGNASNTCRHFGIEHELSGLSGISAHGTIWGD